MEGWVEGMKGALIPKSESPGRWTQDESSLGHAVSSASASLCVKSFRAAKDTG